MFNRLSKPEYACFLAAAAAQRSEDRTSPVGVAAFDEDGKTLGTSYNGIKKGQIAPEWLFQEENRVQKGKIILHAEENLFSHIKGKPHYIGITHSPCFACSKIIAAHDVKNVFYLKQYLKAGIEPELEFIEIFNFYGIKYQQLTKDSIANILIALDNCREFLWRI